ncbi:MAG: hypothetical protein AB1646_03570 [Thermodesulfobacteriota bacterium]
MTRDYRTLVAIMLLGLACSTPAAWGQYSYDPTGAPHSSYTYHSYDEAMYDPARGSYSVRYSGSVPQPQYQPYTGYFPQTGYGRNGRSTRQGGTAIYEDPQGNPYPGPQEYTQAASKGSTAEKRKKARAAKSRDSRAQPAYSATQAPATTQVPRLRLPANPYGSMPSYGGYPYQTGICLPGRS